ncbi:PLP-dependent aminotransferase family protein [Ideonella sp.]|uniref:MocR-like pyridoxine biosynthesis transcription factor PdxR n=1 Tax=Ideonella sp. TaxID=1929293 RepID=UPI002B4A396E|nr:PLP-dependent aminotransferase family protein [Ideonella sp.]HJV71984.1 PLP-dependent aminotransferase family protein [Ideonella sp.]
MHLDLDGEGPQYLQLSRAIRHAVQQGRIAGGARLPATRELAQTLGLARNTVRAAYEHLGSTGLLRGRVGAGSFVNAAPPALAPAGRPAADSAPRVDAPSAWARRARALEHEFALWRYRPSLRHNLQYGEPFTDALLPEQWRNELARAALYTGPGYPPMQGLPALREAVCEYLRERRAVLATPDDVIIVAGTQQGLSLCARVLLDEGDSAVIEEPGYFSIRQTLLTHGARVIGVPVDRSGLVTDQLPARRPGLIFATPSHQFPLGAVMSQRRRQELLRYAVRHDTWIVEDDYDAEIRYDNRQVAALRATDKPDRVIFIGTFSKVLAPSMRLAYMVVPRGLKQDFVNAKRLADMGCPAIEQAALAHFMATGGFERHLRRVVRALRARRNALVTALQQHAGDAIELQDSPAGMHLVGWLKGRAAARANDLTEQAAAMGLGLHPLSRHYMNPPRTPGLLFGFAAQSPSEIDAAVRLLGRAIDTL